jgi:hypothetical protein
MSSNRVMQLLSNYRMSFQDNVQHILSKTIDFNYSITYLIHQHIDHRYVMMVYALMMLIVVLLMMIDQQMDYDHSIVNVYELIIVNLFQLLRTID